MERNTKLMGIKQFKHEDHFRGHVNTLLKHLYPHATINDNKKAFREAPYMGISFEFYPSAINAHLSESFRLLYPKFQKNGMHSFEKLVNTKLQWTGSSGNVICIPGIEICLMIPYWEWNKRPSFL